MTKLTDSSCFFFLVLLVMVEMLKVPDKSQNKRKKIMDIIDAHNIKQLPIN